jgi:helicase SWR1
VQKATFTYTVLLLAHLQVALQDRSDVFDRFRMEYDLATKLSGSKGRATRRIVSAKRGDLALPNTAEVNKRSARSDSLLDDEGEQHGEEARRRQSKGKGKQALTSHDASTNGVDTPPRKKRGRPPKNAVAVTRDSMASNASSASSSDEELSIVHKKSRRGRPPKAIYEPRPPVNIERVEGIPRLRVLRPANLPLPAHFNNSLSAYLNAWHTTGEFLGSAGELEIISQSDLEAREAQICATYARIDQLRSQGLLQDRDEALRNSQQNRAKEAPRQVTAWDTVLNQIGTHANQHRSELRARIATSKRLARLVQIYWDEKLGRGEKHRKAEERRIRSLAKWTVREVRKQWKLAVNVIRAQRNALEKQEKDRLGREQLKNILEQSTQMLSDQHKALLEGAEEDLSDSQESGSEEDAESDADMSDGEESSLASDLIESSDAEETDSEQESADGATSVSDEGALTQLLLPASSASSNGATAEGESIDVKTHDAFDAGKELREITAKTFTASDEDNATAILGEALADPNEEDIEFADHATRSDSVDDEELERKMWEEDESESEADPDLDEDAGLTVEELRKKYIYGTDVEQLNGDATPSVQPSSHAASSSEEDDDESDGISDEGLSAVATPQRCHSQTGASTPLNDASAVKVKPPFLLRGNLRPYQQVGFEWLVNLYRTGSNGILADEMGLGKTIQTIALLGHLACDKGVWGPHLVVAPTSVMLNWEVEFKKFLPGFKILSYYGSQKERKEKRKGWNTENSFNVCITSYQLILADQHILRRKAWKYLVLDEAHHIKNFRSQRWQTLLGFNSQRRLLLTGTPLQNNLMDLWSLMYFLMPNGVTNAEGVLSSGFASMKEFQQWFSNPLDRAVESAGVGTVSEEMDTETKGMVSKLHTLLRPYLLRRLKSEVEKEMPAKYEHVIKCRLSKRQQFLYNDFMSRAKTRESLASGNYLSIINCLMQLRKVCNHPDLFEQRPIVTSFAMSRSAVADYEVKELLVRRRLLEQDDVLERGSYASAEVDLSAVGLDICSPHRRHLTPLRTRSLRSLDATQSLPYARAATPPAVEIDSWTVEGYKQSMAQRHEAMQISNWHHIGHVNKLRCQVQSAHLFDEASNDLLSRLTLEHRLMPSSAVQQARRGLSDRNDALHAMVLGYDDRRESVQPFVDRFAFVTPRAVATDMPRWAMPTLRRELAPPQMLEERFDTLHKPAVKLQIAFPDASLLQYDCGKLQELDKLMDKCRYGDHRILIFTQMTKILDILEIWLSLNGFSYLRLDGSTRVEDRQSLTEKFNRDVRIKAFILSTRSGGLGINLTGADTVLFWDLDWNFQIEAQCMDRAHRIGQTRDVHIYRFVSEHTIEENMLKKSQEKRLLDAMVIQDGQFTTEGLSKMSWIESMFDEGGRTIAGVRVGGGEEDVEDVQPCGLVADDRRIEQAMDAAEDEEDAQAARTARAEIHVLDDEFADEMDTDKTAKKPEEMAEEDVVVPPGEEAGHDQVEVAEEQDDEEGGTVDDYMLRRVNDDWEFFSTV